MAVNPLQVTLYIIMIVSDDFSVYAGYSKRLAILYKHYAGGPSNAVRNWPTQKGRHQSGVAAQGALKRAGQTTGTEHLPSRNFISTHPTSITAPTSRNEAN